MVGRVLCEFDLVTDRMNPRKNPLV
jgi:hypothetical protein